MLDPLKFQVAIQDNASRELEAIEQKIKNLQSTTTVTLNVDGAPNFTKFVTAIVDARKAIQGEHFDKFATNISKAATEFERLNVAFEKFHLTIGSNEGMKNFMEGLGATIRNVQNTMGSLKGRELGLNDKEAEIYIRNVQKIEDALYRIQRARAEVSQAIGVARGNGMNTDGMQMHLQFLESYEARLRDIKSMNDVLSTNGWQTEVFGSSYKQLLSESKDLVSYVNQATRSQERQNDSMRAAGRTVSDLALKFNKLELAEVRANAVKAGIDTTAYDKAVERVERYQRVLDYIAQNGGHDASRITRSVGYREATNDLNLQTTTLKKLTSGTIDAKGATSQLTEQERQLAQAIKGANDEGRNQSSILSDLKSLAMQYLGVWGAQEFLRNIIQIGGQLESQRMSLTAILGQASYANDLFAEIQSMALKSPFGVVQLDQYSKQLSAFGFEYNELFDTTKRLADISAGTGTDFGRLALAIGHVRSELALTGYTLRQFSMANVPMLKKLSENLGVTTQEIRKMVREKKVSYEDVMQVIKELTDEGGIFYNMQEVMSEAVSAKFKNLKDSMDIMYGQMAESPIGDFLKWVAESLMEVTTRWKTFGAVIASTLTVIGLYRTSMMLAANAQKSAALGLLQNSNITRQLTAEDLRNLVAKKQLTTQNIALALSQGKLNATQAEAILLENGYTQAMVKNMVATQGVKGAVVGLGNSMKGLGATLASPLTWILAAAEAVIGTIVAYNSWNDKITQGVSNYVDRQKSAIQEISKYLQKVKEEGKPTDTQDLSGEIEQMKTILKNSKLYTEELEEQVALAPSLKDEYEVLVKHMESANEQLLKMGLNAEAMRDAIKATSTDMKSAWELLYFTGPGKIYEIGKNLVKYWNVPGNHDLTSSSRNLIDFATNDDINKNVDDLQKSMDALYRQMAGIDAYKEKMQEAINNAVEFGYVNKEMAEKIENRPFEEQIRILAEDSAAWERFIKYVGNGDADFETHAENIRNAAQQVTKDWTKITEDDVPRLVQYLKKEYNTNEAGLLRMYINNEHNFRNMLDGILASAKEKSPQIYAALMEMLPEFLRGGGKKQGFFASLFPKIETPEQEKARKKQEALAEHNTRVRNMGKRGLNAMYILREYAKSQGLGDTKGNGFFDTKFVEKYFSDTKEYKDSFDELTKAFKKARDEYEAAVKAGAASDIAEKKEPYEILDKAMDAFNLDKSDKNHKTPKSKKETDEEAKRLRERVRILKEAADSYQYWREKVGEKSAEAHMNDEFGGLLGEQGFKVEDAEKLRKTFQDLYDEYDKIPNKSKAMLEALKEISKEIAQLDRKDFEKNTKDFLSETQNQLDDLTRKWERFNSVLSTTGDVGLAGRLTGLTPNATLADLKRLNINQNIGNIVDFDKVLSLSDEDIEKYVHGLGIAEDKIGGVVDLLKDWKKAEQDLTKGYVENYAKWLGGLVDVQSQRNRNEQEYQEIVKETTRLWQYGILTQEEAERRINDAAFDKNYKDFQLTSTYSNLYNNAQAMSAGEFYGAFNTELDALRKKFEAGEMTAHDYAESVDKLNKIEREFVTANKFLGIGGSVGAFLSGGQSGLSAYYRAKASKALEDGNEEDAEKYRKRADALDDQQKVAEEVVKAFEEVASAANLLANLFDALGMEGAANAFSDAGSVLSGAASGAQSLSVFGPYGMAAGAAIGGLTSIIQIGDKKRERQIEALRRDVQQIDNTLNTIKELRERTLGYDTGDMRRMLYQMYANQKSSRTYNWGTSQFTIDTTSEAAKAMMEYYGRGGIEGTGYRQELEGLKKQREDYVKMYDAEEGKKKSSAEALEEYKTKISELDAQIINFGEDLAKELWDIDIKGWADQISDSLMTAFENGEDAAKAFDDTVQDIMQSVASNIMKVGIIQPMMDKLRKTIFGEVDENGNMKGGVVTTEEIVDNPAKAAEKIFKATNDFMDAEGTAMITAGQIFYDKMNALAGGKLDEKNESGLSNGIKSITEETADLLASYVNAIRADVALMRDMQTTYFEDFKRSLMSGNASLMSISQHTNAIMLSNERIAGYTESLKAWFTDSEWEHGRCLSGKC